jgi:hypothetical protein
MRPRPPAARDAGGAGANGVAHGDDMVGCDRTAAERSRKPFDEPKAGNVIVPGRHAFVADHNCRSPG